MYRIIDHQLAADEILIYLRKSRSDDPLLTVEEVLEKHETILNDWVEKKTNGAKQIWSLALLAQRTLTAEELKAFLMQCYTTLEDSLKK